MVDATSKTDKQLYVATTGNAVLFTNTGLPSPLDLSSEDNPPCDLGSPIHITNKFTRSVEMNGAEGHVEEGSGARTSCNGDSYDPFLLRSEACIERIKQDWARADTYLKDPNVMTNLRSMATSRGLESCPLRNISWRLFLGVLPTATDEWIETVDKQREKYYIEKNKADIDPHTTPHSSSHPLSNESSSAWNQYFLDQDLWLIIDQDVTRTWPEETIFTNDKIRSIMRRVLFTHSKVKSRVDYRQGMHELLANVIYMMCIEREKCPVTESTPEYIKHVVDPNFLEEDSYTLFSELMENCDVWYDGGHEEAIFKVRTSIRVETPFEKEGVVLGMTPLSKKLNKIQGTLLKKHDVVLSEYMDAQELSPQVYGIRWVRLLFGREFVLRDILLLWDVLFAQGTSLDLIDYIAIAILIAMKQSILDHDQGDCLLRLMKYPQQFPVRTIINHALHLKNPAWPNPYPLNYTSISASYEKIATMNSPHRDNTDNSNSVHTEDPSKWNEMKSQGWKSKTLRPNTNAITSQPMSLRSKIQTLPNRARFHTQLSNPHSPTRKPHDIVYSTNSNPPNTTNKSTEPKNQVISLEKEVELLHVKSDYCVGKLTAYVDHLQDIMFNCKFATKENEDFAYLAIAGIKQVRDVLKGQLELGDSSFGLDSTMYHYLRESNPDLVEDHITKDSPPPEPDKAPPRSRLGDKELEEDSIDLFTNVSPPESSAEMVELRYSSDPLLDPSPSFYLSPSHPLESID